MRGSEAGLLIDTLHSALPEGVNLSVHHHEEAHTEVRYVPNMELVELRKELVNPTLGKK